MVPSPTMDDAHNGSITTTASEDWGQALIFQDDWNRMLLTCPYVHTRSLQPRPLLLAAGYVTELPFVILRQWAYVGVQKRFFRLEMGTDGNWFLYPENKSLQQMWDTVVHYLVQEDPGWSFWRYVRHRNNQLLAEGIYKRFLLPRLVNSEPKFSQKQVRAIQTQWGHPDHNHENKGCQFSTNVE